MNKSTIIQIFKYLPFNPLFRPFYSGCGSILFMHKVISQHEDRQRIEMMKANEIDVDFLEKMLLYLKKKYDFISLDEISKRLESKLEHKKKFIVITFDDGYKDNLTLAYPIFKKLDIPFTIYITNCYPNKTAKIWWYMLEDILLENKQVRFIHNDISYDFESYTQKQKDKSFEQIRNMIINASTEKQSQILEQLENTYNKNLVDYVNFEALSWKEINMLSKDPLVTIGCHTLNHIALNTLTREDQLEEIFKSKEEIEFKINSKPLHFAYPFGTSNEINEDEVKIIKSSNDFKTATTTRMGNIFKAHKNNLYVLPRIQVLGTQQDLSILNLYLCGLIPAIKNKLKKIITL